MPTWTPNRMPNRDHQTSSRDGRTGPLEPGDRLRRALGAAVLLALLVPLAACGHRRRYEGDVVLDNRTDLTTSEDVLAFRLSRFGEPYSGNLLDVPLGPASARWIGTFREDYYDGVADLSGGQFVDWQDLYVGYERTTTFEVR